MKILDWYIFKKFIKTFFFIVLIFILVILVIDLVEKIDAFRKMKPTWKEIITDFYFNYIPYLINLVSPLLVFIAAVFVTAQMASRTEIVAMLSAGITFQRFLMPYMLGATMLAAITFYLTGWLIPNANKVRVNFDIQHIKKAENRLFRNLHIGLSSNVYAYMQDYQSFSRTGFKFTLEKFEKNQLVEKLEAPSITWDSTKRKWRMDKYVLRKIKGNDEELIFHNKRVDTSLNIKPEDFEDKHLFQEKLTFNELDAYIKLLKQRGSEGVNVYITEKYARYTYPFAMIILTFFGVIVASKKNRRGIGAQIASGFVLAFVYLLFYIIATKAIANSGKMPILVAVWMPNVIFVLIGIIMYRIMILQDEKLKNIISLSFLKGIQFKKK
ncbi:MAG: LptF/LptG family permease [Thermonemataceae bacterium]|nr:LptF/LptG family permease [Thermonemataceae bacterium]